MTKPISGKQFLLLGLCFLGFSAAQGLFLQAAFVEAYQLEAERLERPYDRKVEELGGKYSSYSSTSPCQNLTEEQREKNRLFDDILGDYKPIPIPTQEDLEICKQAKFFRQQSSDAGRASRRYAKEAESVLKVFGFGGGFGGLVMLCIAAWKSWKNRKQAVSAAA